MEKEVRNMFTNSEFQRLNSAFQELQNNRRTKFKRIWGGFLIGTVLVVIVLILIFPDQFHKPDTNWILPVYGGMAFLITLIGFILSFKYLSEKPFFNYLYSEIYKKINLDESLFLNYKAYDNEDKSFNKVGGLFTRMASVTVRRHILSKTDEQTPFDIYDCLMITSNGKSQQVHFDGVYFVLKKTTNTSIQVRTSGSPRLKGIKFSQHKEFEDIKVYKEIGESINNNDKLFINFVRQLAKQSKYKKVFLSVVKGQIHLGLWYKKHPARKQKVISVQVLNDLNNYFLSELNIIRDLENIDNY